MLKIGLTGGIGSGKSTVAKYFKQLGVTVIDADKIVHSLLRDQKLVKKIVAYFGNAVSTNQQLDRKKLRTIVFTNNKRRKWLEKLLHPAVYQKMRSIIKVNSPYLIFVIPLLLETKKTAIVDRVLVIDTTQKNQIKRTQMRDHASLASIKKIIHTQVTRKQRVQHADDIIVNNGTISALKQQIKKIHRYYLTLQKHS